MNGKLTIYTELTKSEVALLEAISKLHYDFRTDYKIVDASHVLFEVMVDNPFGEN